MNDTVAVIGVPLMLSISQRNNIIIVQNLEKSDEETKSFVEFAKIGIPLTIIQVTVYILHALEFRDISFKSLLIRYKINPTGNKGI